MEKELVFLMGPFVGELYWEAGRFAPMLPYFKQQYKTKNVKFVILTREERFDLYGKYADILVPLRIPGDYERMIPECFRLQGLKRRDYEKLAQDFNRKYSEKYKIVKHLYPDIKKPQFQNKNQFPRKQMRFTFSPRKANYVLVNDFLPNDKPIVVLASRHRRGFKRNWKNWPKFYDLLWNDKKLLENFHFVICGKRGEYIPDPKHRFLDMNDIQLTDGASLVGLLMVILENAFFTFGSQSAIPNISLLYKVDVLEFGCQKGLHTKTYNIHNSPITFIDNRQYNIAPEKILKTLRGLLYEKKEKLKNERNKERMVVREQKKNKSNTKIPDRKKLSGSSRRRLRLSSNQQLAWGSGIRDNKTSRESR